MMDQTRLTEYVKERIMDGHGISEPGYVLLNDMRLDGYIFIESSSRSLVFRMDVHEPFTVYPRAKVEMYLADGTLLYTGPVLEHVVVQPGEELKFSANIRIE